MSQPAHEPEPSLEKRLNEQVFEYNARAEFEAGQGHPVAAREWLEAAGAAISALGELKRIPPVIVMRSAPAETLDRLDENRMDDFVEKRVDDFDDDKTDRQTDREARR